MATEYALVFANNTLAGNLGVQLLQKLHLQKETANQGQSPMTLSTRRLVEGEPVAVLGYPRSTAHHTTNSEGQVMSSLSCMPDYYEGKVLGYHPTGISLAKTAAYTTDIVPPSPEIKDLAGASGGPLVSSSSLYVHGLLCSASESYSICTGIEQILDWSIFEIRNEGLLTIRAMGQRFAKQIRVL